MQLLFFILIGIIVAAIVFSLFNFRFLLYPLIPKLNPFMKATRLTLTGNVLFISDLHLRAAHPFEYSDNLHRLLEQRHVSNLVVVGDLFDSPEDAEKMLNADRATALPGVLGADGLPVSLFFVHGSPQHDPDSDQGLTAAHFRLLGQCAIISCGNFKIVACHGHDMSWKGMFGHGWDRFVAPLSLEKTWKQFARVPKSDWVILGHLHIPGVDAKDRVANCGGWQTVRFLVRPACTSLFLSPQSSVPEIVKVAEA
jgi:UDP-2,3-diacylglucosamine pyrophosphatase LpxH